MWSLGAGLPLHSGVFWEVGGLGLSAFAQISCTEGGKGGRGEGKPKVNMGRCMREGMSEESG